MKRRLLSLVCALAILLGMLTVPTFAATESTSGAAVCGEKNYSSLQAAVDDYTFGIIVLQEDAQKVDIPLNVYLDLNGHNVADVTVSDGATLYVSDSQTDDYTVADGICGTVTGIAGDVRAAEGYLAVTEEDAVSFHRVDLTIKSMSLRPGNAGVYYTSSFAADEVVAAQVESYGVALSVAAEPTAENLETLCGYSVLYNFGAGEKSGTLPTIIQSRVSGTVNIYEDVTIEAIEGVTGANIYLNYGTVNVYGATITGGTAVEGDKTDGKGGNIYVYGLTATGGKASAILNIYGGTIDGNIYICKSTAIAISVKGNAKISNVGGGITTERPIILDRLTKGAEIYVTADDGAFTQENARAADFLDYGYIKAADDTKEITVSGNVLYIGPKEEQAS